MRIGIDHIGITTAFYCTDGNGKFLFHKRSQKCRDEQGVWDSGGGKLEFGATFEENVLKEIEEEYGCQGEILEQLSPVTLLREHQGERTHWIAIPFIVKVDPEETKINEPHKMDELGWFTLDELPQPLHSAVAGVIQRFAGHFRKY